MNEGIFNMDPYVVYVRIDDMDRIVSINSSAFLTDTNGWIEIDRGFGDKYHHAQGNYLSASLFENRGIPRYKLVDGKPVERTQEEIDADYVEPVPQPSETDAALVELAALEAENAAVPIEVTALQVFLRLLQVRLFHKTLNVFAIRFDVTVAGFRTCRRNAECDQGTFFRKLFRLFQSLQIGFFFTDHMIGRRNENNRIRIQGKARQSDCRRCITAHRFQHKTRIVPAFRKFRQLILGKEILLRIADYILRFACNRIRHDRSLEKRTAIKKLGELFRHQSPANRPKTRSASTT